MILSVIVIVIIIVIAIIINIIIIIIVLFVVVPKQYSLMHLLHVGRHLTNVIYICNKKDGCQKNARFIIVGRHQG